MLSAVISPENTTWPHEDPSYSEFAARKRHIWPSQVALDATTTVIQPDFRPIEATKALQFEDLVERLKVLSIASLRRLKELTSAHLEEDGQSPLSLPSLLSFLRFKIRYPDLQDGGLALTLEGNLRWVWHGNAGERVALEFLPTQRVKYVVLKKRVGNEFSVLSGSDVQTKIVSVIHEFGSQRWLNL